MHLLIMN